MSNGEKAHIFYAPLIYRQVKIPFFITTLEEILHEAILYSSRRFRNIVHKEISLQTQENERSENNIIPSSFI